MLLRKTIAAVCIMLYTIGISSPFIYNFSYILQKDYITANICVNRFNADSTCGGKCYLAKNISKSDAQPNAVDEIPTTTKNQIISAHERIDFLTLLNPSITSFNFPIVPIDNTSKVYFGIVIPPPKYV